MFHLIEPKNHCFYKSSIDLFLKRRKIYYPHDLSTSDQNNSIFIIAEEEGWGVYGGALLLKKKVRNIPEKVRKSVDSLIPQEQLIWMGSVFLHIEDNDSLNNSNAFEPFCWDFYKTLYGLLVKFGEGVGTGFLYLVLSPGEYLSTEELGLWPYVVEIKPHESSDRLFHGILSLTGIQYETYLKKWETLEKNCLEKELVDLQEDL